MEKRKINHIFFTAEVAVYGVLAAVFTVLAVWDIVPREVANYIYIAFMVLSFGYLFALEFLFKKYDNAVHFKMSKRYYVPTRRTPRSVYKRKGLVPVIILWIAYLVAIGLMKWLGILSWQLFLIGACLMFALNSFFARKLCLLSVLFLHNKNNCCKNCGINSWDYAIFASALLFAPELSIAATVVNWVIIAASAVMLVVWEIHYRKYPYRFYSETNQALSCAYCLKQCKIRSKVTQ